LSSINHLHTYDINHITLFAGVNICPANFTETLETGVVLCQLAKLIEQKAGAVVDAKVRPRIIGRIRPNARPGSFFARDNVAIFLNFCRDLGVHNNLKFETNDLGMYVFLFSHAVNEELNYMFLFLNSESRGYS
jgi:hypothetical protein